MIIYRCGRLDGHDVHEWTTAPLGADWPVRTYECPGYVLTSIAEQEWADRADFDEARDDEMREWIREGWAS